MSETSPRRLEERLAAAETALDVDVGHLGDGQALAEGYRLGEDRAAGQDVHDLDRAQRAR